MRISVALCTYNGEKYLLDQLASIRLQTRQADELVICDDKSTDRTPVLLEQFKHTAPFPVHIHLNSTTLGCTKNFEQAIRRCTGDIIALADQDNVWLPTKLARLEEKFAGQPRAMLVFSDGYVVDESLVNHGERIWPNLPFTPRMRRRFRAGQGLPLLLRSNFVNGAATAICREHLHLLLPIPSCWVHDAWLGLLACALGEVRTIPEPLILYRRHAGQQLSMQPRTWRRPLRFLGRMNRDYFVRQQQCFTTLVERLQELRPQLRDDSVLEAARERLCLADAQVRMRDVNRLQRLGLTLRELLSGRYHRRARGFRSFVADTFF
jgi:glycosyltransferase involved in cell wall biosynthesis